MSFFFTLLLFPFFLFFAFKIYVLFWREKILRPISNTAVLITGCDTGFGRLAAIKLSELGVTVFAACLSQESISQLEAHNKSASRIIPFRLDVTKPDQVREAYTFVSSKMPAHIVNFSLINNAGVIDGYLVEFTALEMYEKCIAVNFLGVVSMTKTFLPLIRKINKESGGRVITIASIAGRAAPARVSAYSSSKFAVESFSDSLRVELKSHGINIPIVLIEPTFARTHMVNDLDSILNKFLEAEATNSALIQPYGGMEYLKNTMNDYVEFANQGALSPQEVVDVIGHAYAVETPKTRYVIGVFAHFLGFTTLMPAELMDFVQVCGTRLTRFKNQKKT